MTISRRRGATAFFLTLGICTIGTAVLLNVGWIIVNGRLHPYLLVLGIVLFALMTAGMVITTIFLMREIRRNERQDSFLNAVTHELKTPIASIRLSLETLRSRTVTDEQREHFYKMMLEDNDRLLATVEQVLRAGEMSQRKSTGARLPVDMRALAQECVEATLRRHHLAAGAVRVDDRTGGAALIVAGSIEELRSALLNVLDNAIKYSPQGVDILVQLCLKRDGRMTVQVTDKGVGIPPAMLRRVFNRFYRVTGRDAATVIGTGLGLFIVRSVARSHGGDATAQSFGAGRGTTITLDLPLTGMHDRKRRTV